MDKNTLFAFLLIGALLVLININSAKIKEKQAAEQANAPANTEQAAELNGEIDNTNTNNTSSNIGGSLAAKQGEGREITIENDDLKITFNSKGGKIAQAEVKGFQSYNKEPLELVNGNSNSFDYVIPMKFADALGSQNISTQDFVFDIKESSQNKVVFSLDLNGQGSIEQEYRLSDSQYEIDYDFRLIGLDDEIANDAQIQLNWKSILQQQEKSGDDEKNLSSIYYREKEENATYLTQTGNQSEILTNQLEWIGFKQKFFNQTLTAKDGFNGANLLTITPDKAQEDNIKSLTANTSFAYRSTSNFSYPMNWYIGPNKYSLLSAKDNGMEKMVNLGWGIFGMVNRWVIIPMFDVLGKFISNYGIVILVLTLLIKLALSPLTYKSYVSMAKMQVLKPEIDEIKKKHPDDPGQQQAETMKLYSSAGASPLSGCLPNLLQLPILIAMYNFFPAALELRQEAFLWADDLSTYDSILDLPFSIPAYGAHVSLFTILSGLAMVLSAKINAQMSAGSDNPAMKYLPYIMPLFLILIFNSFSSALTYYFFLSNLITFGQQQVIKRFFIDEDKIRAEMEENKKKPKKKSSFQARMEEAMRQQQMMQQQREQQNKK